jgi:glutamate-ammonia-ligase adenylyltransferase
LHDSEGEKQITNSKNSIGNDIFFSRLAQKLIFLLTTQTATGALYDIDTRLRPSGKSGLLISSINAFKNYQKNTAWTWEHQALLRSRLVAGNEEIKNSFELIRLEVLTLSIKQKSLRNDVLSMREKMRSQLDLSNIRQFDLKNGAGGIGDIEFIVQFLVLSYAQLHPELVTYTDNIRQLDTLYSCDLISKQYQIMLQDIYKIYRKKVHLLSLDKGSNLVDIEIFATEINTVTDIWKYYFLEK